jgi:hypothetical protein
MAGQKDFYQVSGDKEIPERIETPCQSDQINLRFVDGNHVDRNALESNPDCPLTQLEFTPELESLFGFKEEKLRSSLKVLFGPRTNLKDFAQLQTQALTGQESHAFLIFYKRNGDEVACLVRARLAEPNKKNRTIYLSVKVTDQQSERAVSLDSWTGQSSVGENSDLRSRSNSPQQWCLEDAPVSWTLEMDPAVLIHMKAVRKALHASRRVKDI